jgi:hypothetical protein
VPRPVVGGGPHRFFIIFLVSLLYVVAALVAHFALGGWQARHIITLGLP